jgi:hypothetical protein
MQLNDIFQTHALKPADIAVLFHVANNPKLQKALPMLAEEAPDLFDAFQNHHGPSVEATLKKRSYMAAFVNEGGNDYKFAGLFKVEGSQFKTMAELDADPRRVTLQTQYGEDVFVEQGKKSGQTGRLEFSLAPCDEMQDLIGRLVVRKPRAVRNYRFLAENLDCTVVEIARHRQLVSPPPGWKDFIVTTAELRTLPNEWAMRLAGWRGVYLIVDERNGERYVGSAYGTENLLGRWRAHVKREKGVTVELGKRETSLFRFSILQLLLHDATQDEVLVVENDWKHRLHTRAWGLNKN